ncbi:unnamed protein product [Medioppia subpectinata]|uniref:Uncharacterized protein n=1 Tax=Medioppia subpectinata TaxID=1979941 RepID=A0A7R9PWM1_9ACAR|nr:unnamed protein product [Medioppia subpectinata]CAG2103046.1 unnamed protein product [Medioppia subpectinata]
MFELRVERMRPKCRSVEEPEDDFDGAGDLPECEPSMETLFDRDLKDDIILMFDDAVLLQLPDCNGKPCEKKGKQKEGETQEAKKGEKSEEKKE